MRSPAGGGRLKKHIEGLARVGISGVSFLKAEKVIF
jgi:hypothetical protein